MKITSFSFIVRQASTEDGYGDNYYVNIDDKGNTNVSHPNKTISYKEQAAILGIIQSSITKYAELVALCDRHNRILELEEYAPKVSSIETSEEEKGIAAAKLSAAQELELVSKSASPQSCALGDEELSTGAEVEIRDAPFEEVSRGADRDIDKPKPTIVITKTTEEDDW